MMVETIRVHVITGFLGAGKTTFIKRVIQERAARETILIVVNDFGEVDIDGRRLEMAGGSVYAFANGCICCSLKRELSKTLPALVDRFAPERLLIEPSGISEPGQILAALDGVKKRIGMEATSVITLIDGPAYFDGRACLGMFFEEQIATADHLIINKTDLVQPDQLEGIEKDLGKRNKNALIWSTTKAWVPLETVFHLRPRTRPFLPATGGEESPAYETITLFPPPELPLARIERLLQMAEQGGLGRVARIKGFVRTDRGSFYVDFSGKNWRLERCGGPEPVLVFIGELLDRQKIKQLL